FYPIKMLNSIEVKDKESVKELLEEKNHEWRENAEFVEDEDYVYMELETSENLYPDLLELGDYLPIKCFAIINNHESYRVTVEKS
ncbi:MAG: hypothetical protein ABEJ72_04190, partial [Candidatus Aenigmatarchaeota archaeon]